MYDSAEVETGRRRLRPDKAGEFVRVVVEAGEYAAQVAHAEMFREDLADDGAEIRGQRQIAAFV